jgi:hypothetical protein
LGSHRWKSPGGLPLGLLRDSLRPGHANTSCIRNSAKKDRPYDDPLELF